MFEQIAIIFDELDFITANLTTVIMLLTLFSLLLANIARYAQAKIFGIPLKMVHQASIPDSLDIWISLVCVLGFGLVLPWAIQSADIYLWLAMLIVTVSCLLSMAMSKSSIGWQSKDKQGNPTRRINLKWVICALGVFAFIYIHATPAYDLGTAQQVLRITALTFRAIYIAFTVVALTGEMARKIFGAKDIMTVEIEGTLYVIAMRHVSQYWVLIPCTIEHGHPSGTFHAGGEKEQDKVNIITFTQNRFIVRDISLLEQQKTIHCFETHELRRVSTLT